MASRTSKAAKASHWSPAEKLTKADDFMSDLLDHFLWDTSLTPSPEDATEVVEGAPAPAGKAGSKATIKFGTYRRPRGLDLEGIREQVGAVQDADKSERSTISGKTARYIQNIMNDRHLHGNGPPRLESHIRFYLNLFVADCGIRFIETNRYADRGSSHLFSDSNAASTCASPAPSPSPAKSSRLLRGHSPDSHAPVPAERVHLAVFATRSFAVGERIAGLQGSFADLTEAEDDALRSPRADGSLSAAAADFSHLVNSQGKFQVFCGPARFVNHDCDNNVELHRDGLSICFKAVKAIKKGDELLTSYGRNYFGEDNRECLCATCERTKKGFFAVQQPDAAGSDTDSTLTASTSGSDGKATRTRSGQVPKARRDSSSSQAAAAGPPKPSRRGPTDRSSMAIALRLSVIRASKIGGAVGKNAAKGGKEVKEVVDALPPATYCPLRDLREPLCPPEPEVESEEESEEETRKRFREEETDEEAEEELQPPPKKIRVPSEKRITYWQTTKQRQLGILPWEAAKPSGSEASVTPAVAAGESSRSSRTPVVVIPPKPKGPYKSYWVTSRDKAQGRVPWEKTASRAEVPAAYTASSTRNTSAARRAEAGGRRFKGLPTAPKGGRLTWEVLEEEEVALLDSSAGRELMGMRKPRKSNTSSVRPDVKEERTEVAQLPSTTLAAPEDQYEVEEEESAPADREEDTPMLDVDEPEPEPAWQTRHSRSTGKAFCDDKRCDCFGIKSTCDNPLVPGSRAQLAKAAESVTPATRDVGVQTDIDNWEDYVTEEGASNYDEEEEVEEETLARSRSAEIAKGEEEAVDVEEQVQDEEEEVVEEEYEEEEEEEEAEALGHEEARDGEAEEDEEAGNEAVEEVEEEQIDEEEEAVAEEEEEEEEDEEVEEAEVEEEAEASEEEEAEAHPSIAPASSYRYAPTHKTIPAVETKPRPDTEVIYLSSDEESAGRPFNLLGEGSNKRYSLSNSAARKDASYVKSGSSFGRGPVVEASRLPSTRKADRSPWPSSQSHTPTSAGSSSGSSSRRESVRPYVVVVPPVPAKFFRRSR